MDRSVEEPTDDFIFPGCTDAASFSQDALHAILAATKASNDLPSAGDDFDYYSTFQKFRAILQKKRHAILNLMSVLVQNHGIREKFQGRELEEVFDLLIDANDTILEKVSTNLDEASGLKKTEEELILAVKPQSAINTSWNKKQFSSSSPQTFKLLTAKNITRPQLSFKDKIDNSNSVFVPIIKEKPNSIKPLAIIIEKDGDREEFCHPYEWEIDKFNPDDSMLKGVEPMVPKPLEDTPLTIIKTVEQLKNLCADLKKEKELAVDLEHHSYRSFQGFTCLMQISTRTNDYIVDVIELRSEMHVLNEVFTDPKIVKVFHGADMDILWLQRDFGLYVVNLFDTGQAARVLHFAHLSLSYLLKHYCKLDMDKRFQLADWRIRPLPAEMIKYARQDTHYLLYIFDCLKNDLIKSGNEINNLLRSTFERSKIVCAKKYQKPLFDEEKYLELYRKCKKTLNARQLYCLKELYAWRDKIARENDESLAYVLPNHMLLQIAEALPKEQQGVLACCNPIPPLVKQQLNEIHSIILKANESSLKQLEVLQMQQKAQGYKRNIQIDLNSLVHCPHDILHADDKKTHSSHNSSHSEHLLPAVVQKQNSKLKCLKKRPTLSALFDVLSKKVADYDDNHKQLLSKVAEKIANLISPYERYKKTEEFDLNHPKPKKDTQNETQEENDTQVVQIDAENPSTSLQDSTNVDECLETNETINITDESASLSISYDILTSVPLRQKVKKKKRKKPQPDITLQDEPQSNAPPRKKSCTPENSSERNITPYDYSQSDYNAFTGKKKSKGWKERKQEQFKAPGKHFGRNRKHAKQTTFSSGPTQKQKNATAWPKK